MLPLVTFLLFALAAFVGYFFLSGFIWGAGYYPTDRKEIDAAARLLELREGTRFYDLGSGYGRMIIAIAERFGSDCTGIEVDPIKCWWTKRSIKRKGLESKVRVLRANFLKVDLSNADAIFIFLSSEGKIMERLLSKIKEECRPNTRIVSFEHRFKNWEPTKIDGHLFLYSVGRDASPDN